jgi:hypothetical protein
MRRTIGTVVAVVLLGAVGAVVAPAAPAGAIGGPGDVVPVVAVDDHYTMSSGGALTVGVPGVLANDVAVPGGGPLTAQLVGATGEVLLERFTPDGAFVLIDVAGTSSQATLTYVVHQTLADGFQATSQPATVTIDITPKPTSIAVDPLLVKTAGAGGLRVTLGEASARLTQAGHPLGAKTLTFTTANGAPLGAAVTDGQGVATVSLPLPRILQAILGGGITARFAGEGSLGASTGTNGGLIG